MQGVRGVRRDSGVATGGFEALRREFGAIGRVNHVVRDTWMVRVLLKQRSENRDGLPPVSHFVVAVLVSQ